MEQTPSFISLHVPFLPPEIHFVLAQHIRRSDLPNYRLASRALAEAGRKPLFQTIVLRSTRASVASFKNILQHEQLSKSIQTLLWDATAWRVGDSVRDWHEWTRHCESRAEIVDPDQALLYRELAATRQYWEAYSNRRIEEKVAGLDLCRLTLYDESFNWTSRLPNLKKIYVSLNNSCPLQESHVCQLLGEYCYLCSSSDDKWLPVVRPLGEWRGDRLGPQGTFVSHIIKAASNVPKYRLYGSNKNVLSILTNHGPLPTLTSLKVRYCVQDLEFYDPSSNRMARLSRYPSLESLSLSFHGRDRKSRITWVTVQELFEPVEERELPGHPPKCPFIWHKLRKLSLGHLDTSPRALLALLAGHSSTLRDMRLQAMFLGPDYTEIGESAVRHTWRDVFSSIGSTTSLKKVRLAGEFGNKICPDDIWDFDQGNLATVVAEWIIQGGECPITVNCSG
jgi:hypothetical protein